VKKCPNCAKKYESDTARFCGDCGTELFFEERFGEKKNAMVFRSKLGTAYYIMVLVGVLITGILIVAAILATTTWPTVLLAVLAGLLAVFLGYYLIPMYMNTYYELTEESLFIRSGWYKQTIPYTAMIGIKRDVKSLLQAPAISFIRLEIRYKLQSGAVDIAHISPVNEEEFIRLLESKISSKNR